MVEGSCYAVNYHRFTDNTIITMGSHHTTHGWAEHDLQWLRHEVQATGFAMKGKRNFKADRSVFVEIIFRPRVQNEEDAIPVEAA